MKYIFEFCMINLMAYVYYLVLSNTTVIQDNNNKSFVLLKGNEMVELVRRNSPIRNWVISKEKGDALEIIEQNKIYVKKSTVYRLTLIIFYFQNKRFNYTGIHLQIGIKNIMNIQK